MEYDLKQARSMQGGLLFNMCFMWFLHFKMEQIQPLLINTVTGIMNMVYSPLFQVYVLGRNLERPFKNPAMKNLDNAAASAGEDDSSMSTETTDTTIDEDEESDPPAAEQEEEDSDDGDSDNSDDASSDGSEDDEEE